MVGISVSVSASYRIPVLEVRHCAIDEPAPPPSDMLIIKAELAAESGGQGWGNFSGPVNQSAVAVEVCAEPTAASAS